MQFNCLDCESTAPPLAFADCEPMNTKLTQIDDVAISVQGPSSGTGMQR